MKSLNILSLLTLSTTLSFSVSAVDLLNLNEFPEWFRDAMAREKAVKKKTRLKLEQFNVNKKVKGKFKLIEQANGTWYYQVDIGTATPLECYIFSEYDGAANSLYSVIEGSLEGAEQLNNKKLTSKFNYAIDSGVIGDTPYLSLDTFYNMGEGAEKVSGILKGISARTDQSLQMCLHNEVGYRQAFTTVFESFIGAFTENEKNSEFFETIYKMSLNGIPVGYSREKYVTDSDGDISLVNDTALFIPVDAHSISRSDSVSTSWSRPDGSLINGTEYSVENSVLASDFAIGVKDEVWRVEGELQGKVVNATLEYDSWLASGFGSYSEIANLVNSDNLSSEFYMWSPDADPTSALKVVLSKVDDNPNVNLKMDMGPMAVTFKGNVHGVLQQGDIEQAGLKMHIELIYSKGEPTLP